MKKVISLIALMILVITLAGCKGKREDRTIIYIEGSNHATFIESRYEDGEMTFENAKRFNFDDEEQTSDASSDVPYVSDEYRKELEFNSQKNTW